MKLVFTALLALSLMPFSALAQDEIRREQEIIACSQMGYVPGEAAFAECRMRVRGDWAQQDYESSQMEPVYEEYMPVQYEPSRPREYCPRRDRQFNPNDYHDEYGRRCKKTHRGWVLCK